MNGAPKPRVLLVRERNVNPWELQNYAPLTEEFDLGVMVPPDNRYPVEGIEVPLLPLGGWEGRTGRRSFAPRGLRRLASGASIVHVADLKSRMAFTAARLKRRLGFKLVVTVWENVPFLYEGKARWIEMRSEVLRAADALHIVARGGGAALAVEGVDPSKVWLIPYGVDLDRFRPPRRPAAGPPPAGGGLRGRLGLDPATRLGLFVGRMVWEKGVYTVTEAAALLARERSLVRTPWGIVLAGDGPERKALEGRIRRGGLDGFVRCLPPVDYPRVPDLLREADFFLLPSLPTPTWQEQYGMALVEAMATGLACVGSHSGAIPEVLGEAGLLVPPGDPRGLSSGLRRLILDDALRARLGERALARARERFDRRDAARGLSLLYRRLTGEETGARPAPPPGRGRRPA